MCGTPKSLPQVRPRSADKTRASLEVVAQVRSLPLIRPRSADTARESLENVPRHMSQDDNVRSVTPLNPLRPRAQSKVRVRGISFERGMQSCRPSRMVEINDFVLERILGAGSFGKVWLASKRSSGKKFAVKVQDKGHIVDMGSVQRACTERELMQSISHPGIVQLHYSFQDVVNVYLVMDFCPCGTLFDLLANQPRTNARVKGAFQEDGARFYLSCLTLALGYLHENGIVYRDLKPENVLIDRNGYPKLTDLGMAKKIGSDGRTFSVVGTPEFMAPEIISEKGHDFAVDWWSLGCLAYEMLTGITPFHSNSTKDLFVNILVGNVRPFPKHLSLSQPSVDFVHDLLVVDPKCRLAEEGSVKLHSFVNSVDWDAHYEGRAPCPQSVIRPAEVEDAHLKVTPDPFANFLDFTKVPPTPRTPRAKQPPQVVRKKRSPLLEL